MPGTDEARRRARHRTGAWRRTSSPRAQGRLTTAPATNRPSASSAETYRIRPTPSCRLMERAPSRPRPRTCGPRAWRALRSAWQRSRRIKGGSRSGGRMVALQTRSCPFPNLARPTSIGCGGTFLDAASTRPAVARAAGRRRTTFPVTAPPARKSDIRTTEEAPVFTASDVTCP